MSYLKLFVIFVSLLFVESAFSQRQQSVAQGKWEQTDTIQISDNLTTRGSFTVSVTSTNVSCFGRCDGTITISLSGNPTYPVQIRLTLPPDQGGGFVFYNNLQASDFPFTITNLCGSPSPYAIRVRDNDGSTVFVNNIYVLAPAEMSIEDGDYAIVNETCAGDCDGSVEIYFVSNAQGNTYYAWSSGENSANIYNKCAGTYTVTVTDDMGCTKAFPFDITAPPLLVVDSVTYTAVFCQGGSGSLTVHVSGGNQPYGYNIGSGYQINNTFTGLAAGTYTVTVIDANNCTAVSNPVTIQENPALNLSETHQNVLCPGDATGSINLTVSGGTPLYTYSWTGPGGFTANTEDISNLVAGTYSVTVTDANNCTGTLSVDITSPNALNISETHTNVTCYGGSNGTITLTVSGGTGPYTYQWSGPSCPCSGSNLTNLQAGTYYVTVRDDNNCTATTSIVITQPTEITVTGNLTNVNCYGECTGTITITVNGGNPPYTYNWTGPSCPPCSGTNLTNLCAGFYNVTITDNSGCTRVRTFQIIQPPDIQINAFVQNPTCDGACNGFINLNVNGGTPPFTYTWSHGPNNQNVTNLCAGTYTVTVRDSRNCTKTQTFNLVNPPGMSLSETHTDVSCYGGNNGSINLTVGGTYTSPLTYNWQGPNGYTSSNEDINNLFAGTYTVTVTDASNCSKTLSVVISELSNMAITASVVHVSCNGSSDGSINITVLGGVNPYSYQWTGPGGFNSNNEDISGLAQGTYYLTVTDGLNCQKDTSFTITQPYPIQITHTQQNVTCFGLSNGSIDITVSDGNPPYTYNWTGPGCPCGNNQDLTNLQAGVYNLTVTDFVGCTETYSVTITQPAALNVTSTQTNVSCFGDNDGSITLTVNGGTPAYNYSWTGPSCPCPNAPNLTNLQAGTYNVTVTDQNNCTITTSVTITQPAAALSVSTTQTNVSCYGGNNGSITLTVNGGTPAYNYSWDGPSCPCPNAPNLTNLQEGTYNVTVTDQNNCSVTTSVTITQPAAALSVSATQTNVSCYGGSNGSITLTVNGGTPAYNYSWTGPSCPCPNAPNLTNLQAGTYNVTVTDQNNCTITTSVTITQPSAALSVSATQTNVSCFGGNNGSITLTVNGGTPAYSYTWTGPSCPCPNQPNLTNLQAGTYNVTVTDQNNCTITTSVTITQPAAALSVSTTQTNVSCYGGNNGSITLTVNGGTPTYNYSWTGPSCPCPNAPNLTNLQAGTYNVTVTDQNNCSVTTSVTITQPSDIAVISNTTNVTCYGQCNGSIQLNVVGGILPYSYNWTGPSCPCIGNNLTNLCAGNYLLTITDGNGCSKTFSYNITQPTQLIADITSQTNMQCGGGCSGTATVTASGGTPNYTYIWSNGQNTSTANGLCAGWVYVTVTDQNNCTAKDSSEILAPPALFANVTDSLMSCGSFPTVVAGTTFLPDGTGVSYTTTITQTDFAPGQTITSPNDITSICLNMEHSWLGDLQIRLICPNGQSVVLKQYPGGGGTYLGEPVSWGFPDQNSSNTTPGTGYDYCFVPSGAMFGTMVATANTYTYSYIDNAGNPHNNRYYLPAGTYTPFQPFSNLVGCPLNGNWTIEVTDNLAMDNGYIFSWLINFAPSTYPAQFCNGSATLSVNGGQAPFTYYWSNGATTQNLSNVCSGTYCVTVTDANNCTATDCVTILDANLNIDSISKVNASCSGVCNGSATVHYSISAGTVTFLWSNNATTQTINNLCAGTYYVTVSTPNGCTDVDSVTIVNGYNLQIQSSITNPILCNGNCNGSASIVILNGQAPFTYQWSPNSGDTGPTISNKCAGTYQVTVTDNNGCSANGSVTFVQPPALQIDSIITTNVQPCNGTNNGTITIYVSGGTPNYQYNIGSGNQLNNQFTNLPAGTYTPTITDNNGCIVNGNPIVITEPTPLVIDSIYISDVQPCFGSANGTVTIFVSGGQSPYQYNIGSGNQPNSSFTGLSGGSYQVTITDQLGCSIISNNLTVNEPSPLTLDLVNKTDIACNNSCTGILQVAANGGVGPYTYSWNPNLGNGNSFTNLCAGWYYATVTDQLGCTAVNQFEIKDTSNLSINVVTTQHPLCNGDCNGSIVVSASGGFPPYTFTWDNSLPPGTSQSNLCAGTFTVTVTDDSLCTRSLPITLINPPILNDSIKVTTSILCSGLCTGAITVYPYGGTGNYTYQWNDPLNSTTQTISNLCAGWYKVTITDQNGCTRIDSLQLAEPSAITTSLNVVNTITCYGLCNAVVQATVNGGSAPYTYQWSNGQSTNPANNVCAGMLYLTVMDNNNCQKIDSINVVQPDSIEISFINVSQVNCHGDCSGQATAQVTGGTQPYTYLWSASANNQNTATADSLCAGFHFVTVTDANGCTNSFNVLIEDTSNLTLNIDSTRNPLCFGSCDGYIFVSASGGFPPYTYVWSNGLPSQNFQINLCAGTYTVTVVDDSLCSYSLLIDLVDPSQLQDSLTIDQQILCTGNCNGIITAHAYGGTPPYTFNWSNGASTQQIQNLCAGWYTVTITDFNGCVKIDSVELTEPNSITTNLTLNSAITCYGVCNGNVIINVNGGIPPYTYQWSNNETTNPAVNLCVGWSYVTITDNNGCTKVDSINLSQPDSLTLSITSTAVSCSGNCTGTATVTVNGGTAPYTYQWDANAANQTTPTADSLCSGIYFVTVTDFLNCTKVASVGVVDTSNLQITIIQQQNPLCNGQCNGIIEVTGQGGYPPYQYSWQHGPTTSIINNLCEGSYTVTVTDDSLCKRWITIDLDAPQPLQDSISILQTISCYGSCNGSIAAFPYGGTSPYTFLWDDPLISSNDTLLLLCTGTYHVTITDANGCSNIDSVSLNNPPLLTIDLSIVQPITCYGSCNGIANVNINGGTPPYSITWSNSSNLPQANNVCAGWLYVTVSDANLCQVIDSIEFTQPDSIQLSFSTTAASCGGNNGTATVSVTGGTPPYTYQWDANANNQNTPTADSLSVNIYFITVTDANGCNAVGNVSVIDTSNLSLTITNIHHITCAGSCDGSATASVSGGYPPYTYLWSTVPPQTDSTAINLCIGQYFVTVVDDSLCSRVEMVEINDTQILAVYDSLVPISCPGLCDASIILIPSGGTPPYVSYEWSVAGQTDSIITNLCPGVYYYTVTDANNCQVVDSVVVVDPGQMVVTINILQAISCNSACDAILGVTVQGALGPYTYQWSNNSTDSMLTNVCAGLYSVTVTGVGGCSETASLTLTEPLPMEIQFTNILQVACGGDCSGRVTALVSGGQPPYTYVWVATNFSANTPTIDSLCADLYFITVTDQNGCTLTSMFEVSDTSNLELHIIDSSMVTCYGLCNGWATAQAQNGYPPYNYLWNTNPQQNTATASNLCAGMYLVTVTDDSLCSRVRMIQITQPDSLYMFVKDSVPINCYANCDGSLLVGVIGGTMPYNLTWSNGANDTLATNLCADTYTLTVTDANACTYTISYTLTQPDEITYTPAIQTTLCSTGTNDGSATITIQGGTGPYQIVWSTGDTTTTLDSLYAGTYYYTITDAKGCQKTDSVVIAPTIVLNALARKDTTICYGDSVQIFGFGGSVYYWTPGQTLSDSTQFNPYAKPLVTTTYYFFVYDSICFDVDSVTIGVYPQFTVDAGQNQTILYDHTTTMNGTCSDPNATFLWIPATGLQDSSSLTTLAHPLQTTTYYLLATNANGCTVIDSVTITVVPRIRIPSGFTPNGDGINDVWIIDLIELFPNCEVMVFNRWGERLFYSRGYPPSERFDGTYKGKPLPTGTYYYVINLHDEAYKEPLTGPLTIMR